MRNILVFFLFLCLILALFSHFFLDGEAISFEETYKSALQLVADIGNVFANMKDGIVDAMSTIIALPEKISNFFSDFFNKIGKFFTDLGSRIGNFFTGIWNEIRLFFGGDPVDCGCDSSCQDCLNEMNSSYFYGIDFEYCHCGKVKYCTCNYCDLYRRSNN